MKRLCISLFAVIVLLFSLTPVALAGTQGSCTPSSNVSLRLWENEIGDTSDGNDTLWLICNHTAPIGNSNLNNIDHTLPGECKGPLGIGSSTWNDCVNSFTIWGLGSSSWHLCFYQNEGYDTSHYSVINGPLPNGTRQDFPFFQDQISSIKVINGSGGC